MKKLFILFLIMALMLSQTNVYADGGYVNIGDSNAATLFTGSASSHYLLLSSNGIVSAWGDNTYGQCGAEPCEDVAEINYIDFENKIIKVLAGNDFSIALDENNVAWGWGNNGKFQLGIPRFTSTESLTYFSSPEKISENIIDIAVGENFSVLLNENGEVLFSGMGNANTLEVVDFPIINGQLPQIKFITANFDNIVAVDENNLIFYWKSDMQSIEMIDIPQVDEVQSAVAGKEHLIIKCLNGENVEFYARGDNSKNQLGVLDILTAIEPVLTLSIPYDEEQTIKEFAGEYYTVINVWNNLSERDLMTEYRWGTDCWSFEDEQTVDKITIAEPEIYMVDYQTVALGSEQNIGFGFVTNHIILFGDDTPCMIPLIEADEEMSTMYEYQYKDVEYHIYNVNFIKLNEETFSEENAAFDESTGSYSDRYLYWEFVNENQFRVKIKNFINGLGNSRYNPSISTIILSKGVTGENRDIGTYGASVWNFSGANETFKADSVEIDHGSENGTELTVSAYMMSMRENVPLNMPPDTAVYYESPGEITENTKLGLYLYGLPEGTTGTIADIKDNTFKITLSGNSVADMDYDSAIKLCYIRASGSQDCGGIVGDYDLEEVSIFARECNLSGFTIKAVENTPEILTVSGSLTKGKENGKIIDVSISGGTFSENLTAESWGIEGINGVSIGSVERIDNNNAKLVLAGNSTGSYSNAELWVVCDASQYSDSRVYDEDAGKYIGTELISENSVFVTKQSKKSNNSATARYTIKFNTNGGKEIGSVLVEKNEIVTEPDVPVREGFIFKGWYADAELTTEYDFTSKVTGSLTLYAAWEEDETKKIILTVGEKKAIVFGKEIANDVAPVIRNDRVMLPIRFVAEALGAEVLWSLDAPDEVKITKGDTEIVIYIGGDYALVNGEKMRLDSFAFLENDRTYLPIRFVAESLGCRVNWNDETRTVKIGTY